MEERHISQYDLYTYYEVSKSLLHKFRKNENIEIFTLDRICTILECNIEDIVEHVPDEQYTQYVKMQRKAAAADHSRASRKKEYGETPSEKENIREHNADHPKMCMIFIYTDICYCILL